MTGIQRATRLALSIQVFVLPRPGDKSMIFTRTVTVDGVTAELDVIVDETALAAYLAPRAMGNKTARTTMTKYVPGESFGGRRTSLVIAQVRNASKRPSVNGDSK